jgi:hypothetical protein
MNKKPFDLQKAIAGAKMIAEFSNGEIKEVEQYFYFDKIKATRKLIVAIDGVDYWITDWGEGFAGSDGAFQLYLALETVTKWMNFYKTSGGIFWVYDETLYDSFEQAKENVRADYNYSQTVPITIEI